MNPAAQAFEITMAVEPGDLDQLGHVNNVRYLHWVQEAATAHWTSVAPAADQAKVLWIVLRHEIDYLHQAFLGDHIIARTWVGSASRVRFERLTEFLRAGDGTLLAKARTIWCPIDAWKHRPVSVSPEVRARFSVSAIPSVPAAFAHRSLVTVPNRTASHAQEGELRGDLACG